MSMYEELYGGSRPEFVGKMGTLPFPETLTSEQEMTAIIGKVLNALETSDIEPASEDEMRTLLTLCQPWGYSALCSGSKGEVTANLGRLIWATGAKRIKPPPFGPFGPESVQKARSCQMERKCQFLTADLRGNSNVFSHVVAKTKDGYWWFAGQSVKATEKTSCSGVAAGTGSKPRAAKEAPSKEPVQAKAKTIDDPMGTVGCLALLLVVACTGLLWWLSPPTIPLWAKIVATLLFFAAFGAFSDWAEKRKRKALPAATNQSQAPVSHAPSTPTAPAMGTFSEMRQKEEPILAKAQEAWGPQHDYAAYLRVVVSECQAKLRDSPRDADYYIIMGRAYADRTPQQDVARAKDLFQQALLLDPGNQYVMDCLGRYGNIC